MTHPEAQKGIRPFAKEVLPRLKEIKPAEAVPRSGRPLLRIPGAGRDPPFSYSLQPWAPAFDGEAVTPFAALVEFGPPPLPPTGRGASR